MGSQVFFRVLLLDIVMKSGRLAYSHFLSWEEMTVDRNCVSLALKHGFSTFKYFYYIHVFFLQKRSVNTLLRIKLPHYFILKHDISSLPL